MPMDEVPSSSSASESDAAERPKAAAANLVEVEIAAPLVAHVNSIAAKYRKGFRGLLLGRRVSSAARVNSDSQSNLVATKTKIILVHCLVFEEGCGVLEAYTLRPQRLLIWARNQMEGLESRGLDMVGLVSYWVDIDSPNHNPSLKDIQFTDQLHRIKPNDETLLWHHMQNKSKESLSYSSKMFVCRSEDSWGEVEVVLQKAKDPSYLHHSFPSPAEEKKPEESAGTLKMRKEMRNAAISYKQMGSDLYDALIRQKKTSQSRKPQFELGSTSAAAQRSSVSNRSTAATAGKERAALSSPHGSRGPQNDPENSRVIQINPAISMRRASVGTGDSVLRDQKQSKSDPSISSERERTNRAQQSANLGAQRSDNLGTQRSDNLGTQRSDNLGAQRSDNLGTQRSDNFEVSSPKF